MRIVGVKRVEFYCNHKALANSNRTAFLHVLEIIQFIQEAEKDLLQNVYKKLTHL